MATNNCGLQREDKITFGKYKGQTIGEVMDDHEDYQYLVWAHENITWFELDEELYEELNILLHGTSCISKKEKHSQSVNRPLNFDEDVPF